MLVRLFTYIKNEQILLPKWLDHHLSIVPGWSIHVVDNNSTDDTLKILQKYKTKHGINIHHHDDYRLKGQVMTQHILKYKNQPGISIPLDGDEFVVLMQGKSVCSDGSIIKNYLEDLPTDPAYYRTRGCLNSVPIQESYTDPVNQITTFKWEWTEPNRCKKFYSNATFTTTDHGNHTTRGQKKGTGYDTDIAYLHYHDTGRDNMRHRCELNITGLGIDIDKLVADQNNGTMIDKLKFTGIDRTLELINLPDREYTASAEWDVKFKWPG